MVLRRPPHGEADQTRSPTPSPMPPKARASGVRLQSTRLRERDRRSSVGQSAAEGRGAQRWPEEDRRSLSLPREQGAAIPAHGSSS